MYVELRAHTCFSFSDGAISAEALARHARELGYTHLGITDTADLGGLARFGVEAMAPLKDDDCRDAAAHSDESCDTCQRPVRPIVGAELIVDGYPAAFLARNPEGYCNLAALVTLGRVGQWEQWIKESQAKHRGRPQVTWEHVATHARGLHALTGPPSGELASLIQSGNESGAERCLNRWRELFDDGRGDRRLAVEVQLHHTCGAEGLLAAELITPAE